MESADSIRSRSPAPEQARYTYACFCFFRRSSHTFSVENHVRHRGTTFIFPFFFRLDGFRLDTEPESRTNTEQTPARPDIFFSLDMQTKSPLGALPTTLAGETAFTQHSSFYQTFKNTRNMSFATSTGASAISPNSTKTHRSNPSVRWLLNKAAFRRQRANNVRPNRHRTIAQRKKSGGRYSKSQALRIRLELI